MLALACALVLSAAESKDLKRGEELFAAYKWAEARAALTKARASAQGLSRAQLLHLLELTGVAAAQQRQTDAAQTAFTELLVLDPDHKLEADYAPRVMTPFYEAKRLAQEKGPLAVAVEPSADAITVRVTQDPLRHVRSVRFHTGGADKLVPLTAGAASIPATEQSWSAELLGENDAEVFVIEPRVDKAQPPVAEAPPPPPPPAPAPAAAVTTTDAPAPAKSGGVLRTVSYVVFAAALVAGGTGGYFGWASGDAFGRVSRATQGADGVIISISERDAYALNAQGAQNAPIANSLYIGAGVLAAAALVLFLVGG